MTIPTRPAPPPPNRSQAAGSHISVANQYNASSSSTVNKFANKKPAPPRPPPPKVLTSAPLKKTGSQKSISILSNLFGASKNSIKSNEKPSQTSSEQRLPPKIPAPPSSFTTRHHHQQAQQQQQPSRSHLSDLELINFDEWASPSPPTIKKSNTGSDCVSMDSFCSSNSSPNNLGCGSGTSQAESGFEDDFSVSDFKITSGATSRSTTFSSDPFECLDDFAAPARTTNSTSSNIRSVKPLIQPKPSIGSSSFYTSAGSIVPSSVAASFDESLSNGKTLIKPSTVSMPTIIKPAAAKGKASPVHISHQVYSNTSKATPVLMQQSSDESFDDDLPSLPMPSIPPPPPPCLDDLVDDDDETCSYGIALYDFESDVVEDLNIRANEKVYLIKQMNDEWIYGRNKRGCEGIFPISYVDIRVPLKPLEPDSGTASRSESVSPKGHHIRALYDFNAETDEDLTIKEAEIINVIYEINPEWLYGSNVRGDYGQFPANFIEYVPQNLPQMPN